MRPHSPFRADDLEDFDVRFLSRADAVVAMKDAAGKSAATIGMRHDVDHDVVLAAKFAQWEANRGYQATYYILHSAPYWRRKDELQASLEVIAGLGHEIGFHINALGVALQTGQDPHEIIAESLEELRGYGHEVTGVVAHGDPICHKVPGGFVNDEIFWECIRESYGLPERTLEWTNPVTIRRAHWADYGLEYDPNWMSRAIEFSDSGGRLHRDFEEVVESFPYPNGQVHCLIHPCWWREAF